MTIAEKILRAKADLDEVYAKGYNDGVAVGGGNSGTVTDLTNTIWLLNNDLSDANDIICNVNFVSNGNTYTRFELYYESEEGVNYLYYHNANISNLAYDGDKFTSDNYRTIIFTDGADVTYTNLINWLNTHGKLAVGGVVGVGLYEASSVDELPSNATEGSIGIVEGNSLVGIWEFNEELTKPIDSDYGYVYCDGECKLYNFPDIPLTKIGIGCGESNYVYISYWYEDELAFDSVYDDGWYECTDGGYMVGHYPHRTINITKDPTDEIFRNWLPNNAKRLSGGKSLYLYQNGEWVPQGELGGSDSTPSLIEQEFTANGEYTPEGADGFSKIIINIPSAEEVIF